MISTVCAFGWLVFVIGFSSAWIIASLDKGRGRDLDGSPRWENEGYRILATQVYGVGVCGAVVGVPSGLWWIAMLVTR